MSNKPALFLKVYVKAKTGGKGFGLPLPPIALYVLHFFILSCEGILSIVPPKIGGMKLNAAVDAFHICILGMMAEGGTNYAHVDIEDNKHVVKVDVRTF